MTARIPIDLAVAVVPVLADCLQAAGPEPERWTEHRPWCDRAWAAFEVRDLPDEVREAVGLALMRIEIGGHRAG